MLIPRFSLRSLLLITTFSACFCYVLMMAKQGQVWALAITLAAASLVLVFLVQVVLFAVAWSLSQIMRQSFGRQVTRSPFATDAPPPQWISPPEDPQ